MNEIVIKANSSISTILNSLPSKLTQRHETHLEMEESTYEQLESVPYEWSQKPLIEVMG